MPETTYVTVPEAARLLGTIPRRIRLLAQLGRIPGAWIDREGYKTWKIPVDDSGHVNVTPARRGPPLGFWGEKREKALSTVESV